ncbi:MAG: fluoride efflux transporter CrcB [Fuerstiella sp.]|nr:fluoride efflux transporter CrcB [Fuerstiella sp.]
MMQLLIPLAVGIGGFVGAMLRFYISSAINRVAGDELGFVGTLTVNLIGCFLIGTLAVVVLRTTHLSPHSQRVLITGLLGSLTTFSTFALECMNLLHSGRLGALTVNVVTNVVAGILLVWVGMQLAGMVFPKPAGEDSEFRRLSSETHSESEF